jgi:fructose-1,6-bisphosphatase/inositol monophosphatase family enzyme
MFREVLNFRCALHDFLNFVTGGSDVIVHANKVTPWDHAANILIAEEAGAFIALNDNTEAYTPSRYGPAFLMATPSKEWWDELYPQIYPKLKERR